MAKKSDFSIDQEVWYILGHRDAELTKGIVTKVGRQYVSIGKKKFDIETLEEKVEYGENGRLYLSEQEYHDEIQLQKNLLKIESILFPKYRKPDVNLEQSIKILELLGE